MTSDRGTAQAMPETAEVDGLPPYTTIQNDGKPPVYSGSRVPSPEPGLIDEERLAYVPGQSIRYVPSAAPATDGPRSCHGLLSRLTHPNGKKRRSSHWVYTAFFLCGFIGIMIGMGVVIRNRAERNQLRADENDPITNDPETPPVITSGVLDLAATECEAGTFVFHQDGNGTIWVQGEFHDAKSLNSSMAPVQLRFDELNLLRKPEKITAVCWSVSELQYRVALYFVLPINYLDNTRSRSRYEIVEAMVHIFDDGVTEGWRAEVFSNAALTTLSDPPSLAAVILPSTGVRLYFSENSQDYDNTKVNIIEVDRGWFNIPAAFVMETNNRKTLQAEAYSPSSPLAAAAVDSNDGTMSAEVHIYFIDSGLRLSRIVRSGSETYPAQRLTQRLSTTGPAWQNSIQGMAVVIPYINNNNTPEADLFFIENNEVRHILGAEIPSNYTPSNAPFVYVSDPKSADYHGDDVASFPQAKQDPPLLAVTSWTFRANKSMGIQAASGTENRVRMQLFYIRFREEWPMDLDRGEPHGNVTHLGMGIVRVTGRAVPGIGYVDDWDKVPNVTLAGR